MVLNFSPWPWGEKGARGLGKNPPPPGPLGGIGFSYYEFLRHIYPFPAGFFFDAKKGDGSARGRGYSRGFPPSGKNYPDPPKNPVKGCSREGRKKGCQKFSPKSFVIKRFFFKWTEWSGGRFD